MSKSYLINLIDMDCPICNNSHSVEKRKRITTSIIKGEEVEHEEIYFLCLLCNEEENEFVPAGIMDGNLLSARDAYRKKKGLLTSKDIADIRKYYGLTQSDFSALLGWGDITITRYETKNIQDETYDHIIRISYENPMFTMECLEKHRDKFSIEKYEHIRKRIADQIEKKGNLFLKKQEIKSLYVQFDKESDINGYKLLDIEKIANIIGYFALFLNNLYKVKLMKMLWYADSVYFNRYGKSMTGLVYTHMPLGALPIACDEILSLPTIKVVEDIIREDVCYRIEPNNKVELSDFSLDELKVLELIATTFKDYSTKEIIKYMHREKAYIETMPTSFIPYSLTRQLNDLR